MHVPVPVKCTNPCMWDFLWVWTPLSITHLCTSAQRLHLHVISPTQPPLTPCHHQQVIYCFNYRQKEYQKEFITTLIGMTPAGHLRGSGGVTITLHKGSSGPGNLRWTRDFRILDFRSFKHVQELNVKQDYHVPLNLNHKLSGLSDYYGAWWKMEMLINKYSTSYSKLLSLNNISKLWNYTVLLIIRL